MIVLDEQLHGRRTLAAIASWYRAHVVSVTSLRPGTVIKDDAVPVVLRSVARSRPTFVTINAADFWRRTPPHHAYCIVAVDLPAERIPDLPDLLRRALRLPDLATKGRRMGKVVRLTPRLVEYYEADGAVHSVVWTDR